MFCILPRGVGFLGFGTIKVKWKRNRLKLVMGKFFLPGMVGKKNW